MTPTTRMVDGYTLVELLVAMIVLTALAALSLPVFLGQTAKAQNAAARSELTDAAHLVELCRQETHDYTRCGGAFTELGVDGEIAFTATPTAFTLTAAGPGGAAIVLNGPSS